MPARVALVPDLLATRTTITLCCISALEFGTQLLEGPVVVKAPIRHFERTEFQWCVWSLCAESPSALQAWSRTLEGRLLRAVPREPEQQGLLVERLTASAERL